MLKLLSTSVNDGWKQQTASSLADKSILKNKIFKLLYNVMLCIHSTSSFIISVKLSIVTLFLLIHRASKVRNKGPKDIMAVEEQNGEVRFSTHLPYPNNLSRLGPCATKIIKDMIYRTAVNIITSNCIHE